MHVNLDHYEAIDTMTDQISQHHLLKTALASPVLSEILWTKLASHVILLSDWKVVRIMQSVYRILEPTLASCRTFKEFMPQQQQFNSISNYIHGGPLDTMETRRNLVWCSSLASVRNVWPLVDTLVNWSQTSDLWTCAVRLSFMYVCCVSV